MVVHPLSQALLLHKVLRDAADRHAASCTKTHTGSVAVQSEPNGLLGRQRERGREVLVGLNAAYINTDNNALEQQQKSWVES